MGTKSDELAREIAAQAEVIDTQLTALQEAAADAPVMRRAEVVVELRRIANRVTRLAKSSAKKG
jgi:hypothetical protein